VEVLKKTCASIDARTPQLGYFAGLLRRPPLLQKPPTTRGV
jgi:hypothetical protein